MTIFRKFIASITTRPAFLDESKKMQAQFDSLPEFVRYALKGQTELPPDAMKAMADHDARFTRAAAAIGSRRKSITVKSNVTVDVETKKHPQ